MRKEGKLTCGEMIKGRLNLLPKPRKSLRGRSLKNQKKKNKNQSRKRKKKLMNLKKSKEFHQLLLVFGSCS